MALIDDIHKRLDAVFASRKLRDSLSFCAPEALPRVYSDQVLSLMEVLVTEIEALSARVETLETGR